MNLELRQRYNEEVLGLKDTFGSPGQAVLVAVAVECEALNDVTHPLLTKILSTVNLTNPPRFEIGGESIACRHLLRFTGLGGRTENNGTVEWRLPKLSEMTGTTPEVTELKKAAWTLLRQFLQEKPV
jgi:hypothetical protein